MSPFLQRLIRRANGSTTALKPRTPALFETPHVDTPTLAEATPVRIRTPAVPLPSESTTSPLHDLAAPPVDTNSGESMRVIAPPPAATGKEPLRPTERATVADESELVNTHAPAPLHATDVLSESSSVSMDEEPRARAAVDARVAAQAIQHYVVQSDPTPFDDPGHSPAPPRKRQISPTPARHAVSIQPTHQRGPLRPDPRADEPHTAEENVVHVTIERFEVRVSDAPILKKPKRAKPARDDSLADYARRRQEAKR